ncbi:hypothetical protein TEA_009900 [Camellia sinensis var. sinensis]|uniref:Uncharacterized protein n=1 Tax=Camellia sinensis var. sinensis TaxID=542762 RepID=A0A4S4DPQ5_CAMSN|nr:hypothetical protein TEA_009900 [Camellia sinensis var. sinensis]
MGGETVLLVSLHSYRNSRLSSIEELARATIKKLTQRMTEHNKAMASAKSDEAKASVKAQKQNTTTGLQTCNNILAMTQLHAKSPSFIGDKRINLSWKEVAKASAPYRGKRLASATNVMNNNASKKSCGGGGGGGGGGLPNQLVNRAFQGLSHG